MTMLAPFAGSTRTLAKRLWAKVTIGGPDDCWPFHERSRTPKGYGTMNSGLRRGATRCTMGAHIAAWTVTNGPIAPGLVVCHSCDNPPCCNPAHLFLDTLAGNNADMRAKRRHAHGERILNAKITADQAVEIRERYAAGGVLQRELAEEFGIAPSCVSEIANGKAWALA